MTRYQGEDIAFSLTLKDVAEGDNIADFEDVERLVVDMFTNETNVVKYEYKSTGTPTTGYETLTLSDDKMTLTGVIEAAKTKLFCGQIITNIYVKPTGDAPLQMITAAQTGIMVKPNLIKTESV